MAFYLKYKEDYVSYDIAKRLRELGFDWMCRAFYKTWSGWNGNTHLLQANRGQAFDECDNFSLRQYNSEDEDNVAAPTLQMAIKWIRETYNIQISIGMCYEKLEDGDGNVINEFPYYDYVINNAKNGHSIEGARCAEEFSDPEIATEHAINYVIDNYLNKKEI